MHQIKPFAALVALCSGSIVAHAQCSWSAISAVGPNDKIQSMVMWDPDGPGEAEPVVAIAGWFTSIGGSSMLRLATWDGSSFSGIAGGANLWCSSLAARANGDLVIGGAFGSAGGSGSRRRIAIYNRSSGWSGEFPISNIPNSVVYTVALPDETSVTIGGAFTNVANATGAPENPFLSRLAHWNGSYWTGFGELMTRGFQFGQGMAYNTTLGLKYLANGDLIALGNFRRTLDTIPLVVIGYDVFGDPIYDVGVEQQDGVPLNGIGRWNGTTWEVLGGGFNADPLDSTYAAAGRCVLELPNGDLIVGGSFTSAGGVDAGFIARWESSTSTWHAMGEGLSGGLPYVEGSQLMTSPGVYALARMPNGDIIAGGNFTLAGGQPASHVARWNGSSWDSMDGGTDERVHALLVLPNGDLLVGGSFLNAGGVPATRIARWSSCPASCPADFNGDGFVDGFDYDDFVACFEGDACPSGKTADFNNDGFPDGFDYDDFVTAFETGCP